MFYPSYDDYMRDVFYFNGLSNPNGMYYMNGPGNNSTLALNSLYPSVYKIVNPVVQKVVSGNNYQFVNEEAVNNTVDVVLGIVEGDVNSLEKDNNDVRKTNQNSNSNVQNVSSNNTYNSSTNYLLKDLIRILVIRELISKNNVRRFPCNGMPYCMGSQMMMQPYMMN